MDILVLNQQKKIMNKYLKRIIKAVLFTAVAAAVLGYDYKVRHDIPSWGDVMTTKFWICSIIGIIPSYTIVWAWEDTKHLGYSEQRIISLIVATLWGIAFGIVYAICHFVFHYDII